MRFIRPAIIPTQVVLSVALTWFAVSGRYYLKVAQLERAKDVTNFLALYRQGNRYRPLVLAAMTRLKDPSLAAIVANECASSNDLEYLGDVVSYLLSLDNTEWASGLITDKTTLALWNQFVRSPENPEYAKAWTIHNSEGDTSPAGRNRLILAAMMRKLHQEPALKARLTPEARQILVGLGEVVAVCPPFVTPEFGQGPAPPKWRWSVRFHDVAGKSHSWSSMDADITVSNAVYYNHGGGVDIHVPPLGETTYEYWCEGSNLRGGQATLTFYGNVKVQATTQLR
jgi:hypothetical protein